MGWTRLHPHTRHWDGTDHRRKDGKDTCLGRLGAGTALYIVLSIYLRRYRAVVCTLSVSPQPMGIQG